MMAIMTFPILKLIYSKEASRQKQEIDQRYYTVSNQKR